MNTQNSISSKRYDAYVQKLAEEVAEVENALRNISQRVGHIKRHVDTLTPENSRVNSGKSVGAKSRGQHSKVMSDADARAVVDNLAKDIFDKNSFESARRELSGMTVKYGLTPIARVLGMTNTALPPKDELVLNIITRLQQSAMLTEGMRKIPRVAENDIGYGD